jgi:hypothetical protein
MLGSCYDVAAVQDPEREGARRIIMALGKMDRAWHGALIAVGLIGIPFSDGFSIVLVIGGLFLLLQKSRD